MCDSGFKRAEPLFERPLQTGLFAGFQESRARAGYDGQCPAGGHKLPRLMIDPQAFAWHEGIFQTSAGQGFQSGIRQIIGLGCADIFLRQIPTRNPSSSVDSATGTPARR